MASRKQLKQTSGVKLPDTIPCNECRIQKSQAQYSPVRLEDLRKYIIQVGGEKNRTFQPKTEGFIRCTLCVGGPRVEHECYHCEIVFPRTDKYFSKAMLKNRKDEALCWSCSQREQNDTLSSGDDDSDDGGGDDSDNDSNESETTFVTNQFEGMDVGKVLSSVDDSSGGVSLSGSNAPSTGGTFFGGAPSSASAASSGRGTIASHSVAGGPASTRGSIESGGTAPTDASNRFPKKFDPHAYSSPRRRSPTGSVASGTSIKTTSTWAKIKTVPTALNMDVVRDQHKDMARRAKASKEDDDVLLAESESDSD